MNPTWTAVAPTARRAITAEAAIAPRTAWPATPVARTTVHASASHVERACAGRRNAAMRVPEEMLTTAVRTTAFAARAAPVAAVITTIPTRYARLVKFAKRTSVRWSRRKRKTYASTRGVPRTTRRCAARLRRCAGRTVFALQTAALQLVKTRATATAGSVPVRVTVAIQMAIQVARMTSRAGPAALASPAPMA